jgi:hypothetical protein
MPPAKHTPAALLDLLIDRAAALHAAGVTSITIDGLSATLAAPAPPASTPVAEPDEGPHIDPMYDPATYPGGRIPGFTRPKPQE